MKTTWIGIAAALLASGCGSYRFTAQTLSNVAEDRPALRGQYRIAHLTVTSGMGFNNVMKKMNDNNPFAFPDPWSIPQVSARAQNEVLQQLIARKYPSTFVNDSTAIPIDLVITCTAENKELGWTFLFPYLVSLGTLPAFQHTTSDCTVEIRSVFNLPIGHAPSAVRFGSDWKLTAFTPIGAMVTYDELPGMLEQRSGCGVDCAPHQDSGTKDKILETFAGAVAEAVVTQLREIEDKGLLANVPQPVPPASVVVVAPPEPAPADVAPAQASPAAAEQPLEEKLKRLKKLRDTGAITEKEYVDLTLRIVNGEK